MPKKQHRRSVGGGIMVGVSDHCNVMPPGPLPVAPRDPALRDLVQVGLAGEAFGLPVEVAFTWAFLLRLHGTAVHTSVEAFRHAMRWRQ